MQPVRLQRIVLAAEHDADIGGVLFRRIEIGVACDRKRQVQPDICHGHQRLLPQFLIVAQFGMIGTQQFADPHTGLGPDLRPQRHEGIQRRLREHAGLDDIYPAFLRQRPEIEHITADRNADARRKPLGREHAIGEILDRKIRCGLDRDEGAELGIVGVWQGASPIFASSWPSWPGSTRPSIPKDREIAGSSPIKSGTGARR
jgi:hypothetical protein